MIYLFLLITTTTATTTAMTMMMRTRTCQYKASSGTYVSKLTADEQAPPLLAVSAPGFLDGATNLRVRLDDVGVDLLTLLLDVLNEWLLLHDNLVEVLEQLCQFDHLSLDLLDGLVALLDVPQARLGLAATVGVNELQKSRLASYEP
jgi:hypothetical protein